MTDDENGPFVKDTLRDLNHSAIKNNFRLNVWLPTEFVGKVIGAKGAVIQHIQRETSTRVVILPTLDQQPLWSPFTITGDPNKVLIAYNLLKSIVEEEEDVVAEFKNPFVPLKSPQYSQQGAFVKKLSADTGVRIFIPEYREDHGGCVSLEGPVLSVFRALAIVADHFDSEEVKNRLSAGNSASKDGSWRKAKASNEDTKAASETAGASKISHESDKAQSKDVSHQTASAVADSVQSESKSGKESAADTVVAAAAASDRQSTTRSTKQEKSSSYGYTPTEVKIDIAALEPREADDGFFVLSVDVPVSIIGLVLGMKFPPFNLIDTISRATFTLIQPPPGTTPTSKRPPKADDGGGDNTVENVPFSVKGKSSKNVALSASFLMRIAGGERTKDVLNDAQACSPDPADQLVPDKAVSRSVPNRKRSEKERGGKRGGGAPAVEENTPAAETAPARDNTENASAISSPVPRGGDKRGSDSSGRGPASRSGRGGRGSADGRGRGRGRESKRTASA